MALSQLRPLAFGEILDGAFTLYRRHFSSFVRATLLAYAPVLVVWAVVGSIGTQTAATFGLLLFLPAVIYATVVSAGALTRLASNAYLAQPLDVDAALREARRRFFTLWGTLFLQGIITGFGFLLMIVPGFIFMAMFFAMVPAVVLEGLNSITSQARSRELAAGAWGRAVGVRVVFGIIAWLPSVVATLVAQGLAAVLLGGNAAAQSALVQMSSALVSCFMLPLGTLGIVLLYYDRRVRTEALDLELAPEAYPEPAAAAY
jgi:hypothetical protein